MSNFRKGDKSMFSIYERIKELANRKGISVNSLEETLGYSRNTIYSMKTKKPSAERVLEIAEFFGVSTDYLLGRTDEPTSFKSSKPEIDPLEEEVMVMFRKETSSMTEDEKVRFNRAVSGLIKTAKDLVKDESLWK